MIPLLGSLLTVAGILINIALPETLTLPDLSGSLLIATLAARRRHWPWALPLLILHDLALYWSPFPLTLLCVIAGLLLVVQIDLRLGAALPQRMVMVAIAHIPLIIEGWSLQSVTLSLLLTVMLWYWIREQNPPANHREFVTPAAP